MQLLAATYFMVAGGPFGLEDVVQGAGYLGAAIILLITPIIWSLPTALMVAELSAAIPEEGGFYAWVKRAMGPFWGFQEAWLSLAASVFDMAIYPTLFVLYLGHLFPSCAQGWQAFGIGLIVIAACVVLNMAGVRSVGDSSMLFGVLLLSPFAVMVVLAAPQALTQETATGPLFETGILGGILIAMWNCMGWDNASTVAGEVERPQRSYPLAMFGAVSLMAVTYILPVLAVSRTGIHPSSWTAGSWAEVARTVGGSGLAIAVVLAGMVSAFGLLNALVMSYTRLPVVLAEDGFLPKVFAYRTKVGGAPWMSILACSVLWALCLGIGFQRLVALDIMLYGLALILEFLALFILRVREPALPRTFRVPGGLIGAGVIGIFPAILLGLALWNSRDDHIGPINALVFGVGVIGLGILLYAGKALLKPRKA